MSLTRRIVAVLIGVVGLGVLQAAHGADAVRGKALFANTNGSPQSCASASCHSGFPAVKRNSISKGTNPSTILNAISGNTGGMRILASYVNATDAADIAAYIANPAAGDGAAGIALSATTLTFPSQSLGTTSAAQTVTVSNTGTAVLNLTALTFGGVASAEFARAGTCQVGANVAAGGSCSLQVTFTPAASGARNATLTISHNAASGTSTLTLVGTGALAPAAASVTPTTLSFTQTVNTMSLAQAVTVRNSGGQPLTLSAIGVGGTNAAEFAIGASSTCAVGTVLNASASCNLQLTFQPTAAGARSATLSIGHNAAASPSTVVLTGSGTATAQPAVSLSVSTLDFGMASLGAKSAAQSITLTNSGQAPLTLATLALGGTAGGDFALRGHLRDRRNDRRWRHLHAATDLCAYRSRNPQRHADRDIECCQRQSGRCAVRIRRSVRDLGQPDRAVDAVAGRCDVGHDAGRDHGLRREPDHAVVDHHHRTILDAAGEQFLRGRADRPHPRAVMQRVRRVLTCGRRWCDGGGCYFLGIADPTHAHRIDRTDGSRSVARIRHDVSAIVVLVRASDVSGCRSVKHGRRRVYGGRRGSALRSNTRTDARGVAV